MEKEMNLIVLFTLLTLFTMANAVLTTMVVDVDGQQLETHTNYYVLPVFQGMGGGLSLLSHKMVTCPRYVAQELSEMSNGLPLKFYPANSTTTIEKEFVELSTDMNLVFAAATTCVQSTGWRLGDADRVNGRRYVISGGRIGSPGLSTVSSWFKIEKYGDQNEYKLVHCPSVCSLCKVVCGDMGVFVEDDGNRWLELSDVPFPIFFKKA